MLATIKLFNCSNFNGEIKTLQTCLKRKCWHSLRNVNYFEVVVSTIFVWTTCLIASRRHLFHSKPKHSTLFLRIFNLESYEPSDHKTTRIFAWIHLSFIPNCLHELWRLFPVLVTDEVHSRRRNFWTKLKAEATRQSCVGDIENCHISVVIALNCLLISKHFCFLIASEFFTKGNGWPQLFPLWATLSHIRIKFLLKWNICVGIGYRE